MLKTVWIYFFGLLIVVLGAYSSIEQENRHTTLPYIKVYFTPGTDCEDNIVAEIEKADKIDIAVYSITNRKIVDALLVAKKRGAKIRVITDRAMAGNQYSLDEEMAAAGIPVLIHKKHKIMH
ncbi:MAG: hypothetical protein IKJ68_06275, partial [Clostridia bacterium]|nr:hypothetical protein [Clostridia bacterium]